MSAVFERELTLLEKLAAQWRVLYALMLRDIRTRFGGTAFGFLIAIGWPLTHILVLLVINSTIGRAPPFGDSPALWFATGVIPFMCFSYVSRFIMLGIALNRPLLTLPAITVIDILFARSILEVLSSVLVILIVLAIFVAFGVNFVPIEALEAMRALFAALLLGLGTGVVFAVVGSFSVFWITFHALMIVVLWFSSGVFFVPDAFPEVARNVLWYNPVLQCIEWMRSAYYIGYGSRMLSKNYVVAFGVAMLLVGLIAERLLRGRIRMQT
jgi:capsular polysaccharide transport system permease protein